MMIRLAPFSAGEGFNPVAAQKQFSDAERWRKKHEVDKLYEELQPKDMEISQRFYPRWTGRRDKLGIPLFVYRLASLEPVQHELDAIPAETRFQRIVSFGSMWRLRHHLQEASRLSTANYPETLHAIAIVNSPSFFPTIWSWIKGWFDEGTRQKIHVLGKDPGSTLSELVHTRDLPVAYGGELEWKFEDEPHLDEDTKQIIGEMPKGPVVFTDGAVMKLPATTP
ncbi:CRAL-TRIO domain-containing protein [Flammula alnicola]|nr:CRAL-TRIO domain-containing protein [Flammula alnicola]